MNACPQCKNGYLDEVAICPRDGSVLGAPVLEGRYRLISKLGEGGMGLVYLGEHLALRKRVAVKVLRGEIAHDAQLSARFQQEAVAASQIGHEHIVAVTDFGHLGDGSLFYVMEHLEGETLSRALDRQRPMALRRALTLLSQIASAIGAAHERGIVHRDLKPQNVMVVTRDGVERAKVFDFGISKVNERDPNAAPITEQGAVLGTAEYMAPEQASGESVDPRTDIYALGVMAYELVTGTLPFRGEHTIATILKQINETPQRPSERAPWLSLPERLDALIMACLAKNPIARPDSMTKVRNELQEISQTLGASADVAPPSLPSVSPIPLVVATPGAQNAPGVLPPEHALAPTLASRRLPTTAKPRRTLPVVWIGAAVALITVAFGVQQLLSRGTGTAAGESRRADAPEVVVSPASAATDGVASAASDPRASETARAASGAEDAGALLGARGELVAGAANRGADELPLAPAQITVRTTPPGAAVFAGPRRLGTTPLAVDRSLIETQPLRLVLSGYVTREVKDLPPEGNVEIPLERASRKTARKKSAKEIERVDDLKVPFP